MKFEELLVKAMPLIKAVLTVIIGFIIVGYLKRIVRKILNARNLDKSFVSFVVKSIGVVGNTVVILSALTSLGISTTGLVAALSAAVVAIGVALKDSLGNIAGGILLLISPRFATGDFIDVEGDSGSVTKIDLLHTTIKTPDNKIVSIPNGVLINSHITNYSEEKTRRVDITLSVPYSADTSELRCALEAEMEKHPKTLKQEVAPMARVMTYGQSSVDFVCRAWCESDDYWDVYFDLQESFRAVLKEKGLDIPFNQLDVHIVKD